MKLGATHDVTGGPAGDFVADVLVPVAVDIAYSYKIPRGLELAPGICVATASAGRIFGSPRNQTRLA